MKRFGWLLSVIVLSFLGMSCGSEVSSADVAEIDTTPPAPPEPTMAYGIQIDSFEVIEDTTHKNMVFSDILLPHQVTWGEIEILGIRGEGIFNIDRDLRPDRKFMLLCTKDSTGRAQCLIYEKDPINYIVFDLRDTLSVQAFQKDVDIVEKEVCGVIAQGSSLSKTLYDSLKVARISESLVDEIADVYAYTIDFFNIKAGDYFKIIYEEKYVEEELVGRGVIKGMYFRHKTSDFYGIRFMQDSSWAYFDETGKGLKKAFLKAPLKYSRISSGYSKKRFHPVQKRYKAHLGTDYAAPKGTPIWSVGDGTVIAKGYGKGNGNYVKIKHNNTITTQYLHMSKFADGIKKGVRVSQGQVIGYVGSTGLATGPHVCFRFWKNGKQVDHRKEKFETSDPVRDENRAAFDEIRDQVKAQLDAIPVPEGIEAAPEEEPMDSLSSS